MFEFVRSSKTCFHPQHNSHSTDFEVHRNWLAITHSLPLAEWYTDATSEWTLDYPPLFAYFEWTLSQVARFIDPGMLRVQNLNYASAATVTFQRCSVIGTDAVLMWGTYRFLEAWRSADGGGKPKATTNGKRQRLEDALLFGAIVGNAGLLLIDHIHFQYNGVLFGVLLRSVAAVWRREYGTAAASFAVLLCMKHIFLYVAPVFGVYLLRFYVLEAGATAAQAAQRFCRLAGIVLVVVAVAFGPFVGQLPVLAARLFPFKRGLTHAYWAPNCWALYNAVDKALALGLRRAAGPGTTSGLVGQVVHQVLPAVQPWHTFALSAGAMVPALWRLARSDWLAADKERQPARQFVRALVLCAGASFLFGWHVHEKAVLMMVVPLALLCLTDGGVEARWLEFLTAVAHYSLFPLLDVDGAGAALTWLKYGLWWLYAVALAAAARRVHGDRRPKGAWLERAYLWGLHALFGYEKLVHGLLFADGRLPFLPLLLCSVYCAVGVVYFWVRYYWAFMVGGGDEVAEARSEQRKVQETLKEQKKKRKNK